MRKIILPISPRAVETGAWKATIFLKRKPKGKGNAMEEDLTFEEHVALVERRLAREPRYRLALLRLMGFCEQERALDEIEREMASWPEMTVSPYAPRTVLSWLVEPDAIRCVNEPGEDSAEEPANEREAVGTSEADTDSGEFVYRFETTVVGAQVLDNYRASKPLEQLMAQYPSYEEAFRRVLEACAAPRSRKEVEALFAGDPILEVPKKIYPNFFLDKLEGAGGLMFKDGWTTTDEGAAFLAAAND